MQTYLKKNRISILLIILFGVFTAISFFIDFEPGKTIATVHFFTFFKEMIVFMPLMFILVGLGDVWISKEKIEKHIGNDSGVKGIIYVVLLSMVQAGPLYGAFPVAYLLWKKGASVRNIFIYLGAFSTLKIPMLTFEIGFLGLQFTLLRTLITLPVIIVIALIMDKYFKNKKFTINEV